MLEFENESTLKMISHFIKLLILKNIVKQNYKLQFTKMIEVWTRLLADMLIVLFEMATGHAALADYVTWSLKAATTHFSRFIFCLLNL